MAEILAVLFDYGLVLSAAPDATARQRMEELLHTSGGAFETAYWRDRDGYDRGRLTAEDYWRGVGDALGEVLDAATLQALIDADVTHWSRPNDAMIAWAADLQRQGIPTGILSNLGDAMETGLRKALPWLSGFAHMTFSHRLGVAKPDKTIYLLAAEGLGVPPQKVLFLDDKAENVAGARAVGMTAILYSGHAEFVREMKENRLGWLLP